jgi:hypothetical protein
MTNLKNFVAIDWPPINNHWSGPPPVDEPSWPGLLKN